MDIRHQPADRVLHDEKRDDGPMKRFCCRSVMQARGYANARRVRSNANSAAVRGSAMTEYGPGNPTRKPE